LSHESTKDTKLTGAECRMSVSLRFRVFVAIYFGFGVRAKTGGGNDH
jgi:hypothetical protein